MSIVVPAVLPASKKEFDEALAIVTRIPSVTRIQIDVVDGSFASPASWPYAAPAELQEMVEKGEMLPRLDRIAYEIDLMCLDAESAAQAWLTIGATRLTFHAESAPDLSRFIRSTRIRYGHFVAFGLALNIESDVWLLETNLAEVEYVQFMGIGRIGKQGQPFDWRVIEKIRAFRERHPEVPVQVDGGVSLENARELLSLGVSNLVVGSAILRAKDPYAVVAAFDSLESSFGV